MIIREPSDPGGPEYSSRITRQLVNRAEEVFGNTLDVSRIEPLLAEMLQDTPDLDDNERKQLEEIARLQQKQAAGAEGGGAFACAGDFTLTPSEDQMFLALSIRPPISGGQAVSVEEVLAWLKQRNISRGVDLQAIRRCVEQAAGGEEVKDVAVVRGRAASPGQDARIERFARRTNDSPLEPIGQRALMVGELLLCRQGDVVMHYIPPAPGQPGHTALGETLEALAPQDLEPAAGRNIRLDGHNFVADVTGVVVFEDCRVEARKALVINQDLTRKNGLIEFDGEVQIRAAVRSGACIRATGNIVVDGPVEAAEIESIEGDVVLRSGVAGQEAAVIRAGRDILARFAESASLFAARDITLEVGSLHSRLIAHHQVSAIQGKGHLAGGTVMAGECVSAKQLGARGGVATDVTVGIGGDALKTLSQIDQLAARAAQRRENCTELIRQIERAVGDPLKLSPKELEVYTRLRQLLLVCDVQLRKLNHRRRQVLAEAVCDHGGRIEVLVSIMPNVQVTIGAGDLEPEGRLGPCTLFYDEQAHKVLTRRGV